ncbi:hypothetical protein Osc7112_3263 [Oscillatoria nigro-viridis PCC 7112]|uniref:Uncharacterized protein n=1 Tax=Phormidium nigroviride PCC 7112 TaxID=179408 RepID=K9VI76_9CYAN|nr:hypothetical protein [Oscillatoria nigro-viridis]AFZ07646.1 hypothetical protein Osc7112_3263 [Oscillatoria nigro-viridis PCC 7112]
MKKLLTTTIVFISTANPCFAMTPSELATFATNYKYNENAPVAYSYYDKSCQTNVSVYLVKIMDLGNGRIGGITNQFLCWGATYTYFEMTRGNLQSIRAFVAIGAGRSTRYTNWGPIANPGDDLTPNQLTSVAKTMTANTK